jgi:tetratricopeptide (TPR) repeat protein
MSDRAGLNPIEIGALVALVNQDRLRDAELRAQSMLKKHPDIGMLWKILSVALVRQGKDALAALRRTVELMPHDAEALHNLGAALHDREQWAESLTALRRALAIQPNDTDALVDAANALRALGKTREAIPLYQRALQLDPRLAEAHNNLGNAFLELRQHADAAACYQRALDIKPGDLQILLNLGAALTALGRREQAADSYRRALAVNPLSVDAHNRLGNVLRDLGNRREAASLYARAVELDPRRPESHCNLGTLLFEMRRVDEAVASHRQALALQPDYAPAHLSLGLALRQQRRPDDAEASCNAALAIDKNYVEALSFLGELRADRGQFSEAEALFSRAIAINPDFSYGYCSIATHRKMTAGDTSWLRGAQALLAKRLPLAQEIGLRYSLGKYFDDVGRYDEAFAHYAGANGLTRRYGAAYDAAAFSSRVDRIIQDIDAAFLARAAAQANPSDIPVFIIGMPRSGTSLAEQILASHPMVFGAGEVTFWNAAYDAYRRAEAAGSGIDLLAGMAREYLDRLTATSGGTARVVDKMPGNFLYAGLIHAIFPRARIIHMRRHPIDTCLSIYFQNFFNIGPYANDLHDLAHYYGEYLRMTAHWRSLLPASALLEVPYEGLIDEQEAWTRRMLDFAGLPWDSKCLEFHRTDRVVITASKWQVRQRINKSSAGRWRNYEKFVGPLERLAPSNPG